MCGSGKLALEVYTRAHFSGSVYNAKNQVYLRDNFFFLVMLATTPPLKAPPCPPLKAPPCEKASLCEKVCHWELSNPTLPIDTVM